MDHYSAEHPDGLRQLRLNRMFTLVAVLARALGIGLIILARKKDRYGLG